MPLYWYIGIFSSLYLLFNFIHILIPLPLQLLAPFRWGTLEVALVGEIEVGARAEAAAVGNISHGQGGVAQQAI